MSADWKNLDASGLGDAPISLSTAGSLDFKTPFTYSKIMIVDDEPTTIEILEMFLQGEGYERLITTTDSRRAVELAKREAPDVLLLDLMMPEVDGLEVLETIREDETLRHLPVIILTSSTDPETKLRALEIGATDLLAKPVDPSELALRLKNTLTAKVYQDRLAYYDRLTGLPNRRFFIDRMERALAEAKEGPEGCALLRIGLDRFTQINDTLGHRIGDALLKAVSERLHTRVVREIVPVVAGMSKIPDPLCRFGGDEFALLIPGEGAEKHAAGAARRLLGCFGEPFRFDGQDLFVTSSIGISRFPRDGNDLESLLASANIAMSHAKKRGHNDFQFYDPSQSFESVERLSLENQLRRALERKELELHYQPKSTVSTDRLVGVEALMRWDHPELGLIQPDRFISIAEETGLIAQLGEWALRTGCQQNQAWQNAGLPPISIAINVSAKQFQSRRFVETIRSALEESRMDASHLVLELTESVLMDNAMETARMLQDIQAMGVRISVDDFGTGYSSLSTLKRFPIDELKIDRSFVVGVPQDEDDSAIVSAVILMGHALGLTVVAEGVETVEQLAFLTRVGRDTYQGYLRSKPLEADGLERLLREQSTP